MIVTRNSNDTFTAAGNGPLRPIVAEGVTRPDAMRAFAHAYSEQTINLAQDDPVAYTKLIDGDRER